MDPVLALLLGLVQGVTEWLPISSSGWTTVTANAIGVGAKDALAFAFFLHLGTLLAVVVRLRGDVRDVLVALPKWRSDPLVRYLLVTTLISLPLGLAVMLTLEDLFEQNELPGLAVTVLVGVLLVVTGVVLWAAKDRQGDRKVDATTMKDWVLLGLAQGITPLPGISRSGMTVSALLIRKVDAEESLRLSFLMAIPVTIAVVAYEVVAGNVAAFGWPAIVSGVVGSFALGYLTIEALMTASRTVRWDLFCIVFGVLAVVAGLVLLAF